MPDSEVNFVSNEWLQSELRSGVASRDLIVLDCRSSQDYSTGHVRSAANFSIPSIMLRRLAAGKIELTAAIKCRDLKNSQFVLYNDGQQVPVSTKSPFNASDVISVLYRRLKEDDCRVAFLRGKSQRAIAPKMEINLAGIIRHEQRISRRKQGGVPQHEHTERSPTCVVYTFCYE